jgi:glucosyl-dolichyl phosphate glucuronosyltransferase
MSRPASTPALSVIIATRDRPEDLGRCLAALALQTLGDQLEVIVVDDGSTGDIETVVRESAVPSPLLRYIRQEGNGAASARDLGTAEAASDFLAYLDDDAVPVPVWAEAVVSAFNDWGCAAVAGRIVLRLAGPAPDWVHGKNWRFLSELDLGSKPLWLRGRELPYSANCAVTRSSFTSVGGFASAPATRTALALSTGEDTWFFDRVRRLGGSIAYVPQACVEHVVPARRLTTEWFMQRAAAQGTSTVLLRGGREPSAVRRLGLLVRLALWVVVRLPAELARDTLLRRGTIGARLFLAYVYGAMFALVKQRAPGARESL